MIEPAGFNDDEQPGACRGRSTATISHVDDGQLGVSRSDASRFRAAVDELGHRVESRSHLRRPGPGQRWQSPARVVFEYRSIDANGNVEATKALTFTPVGKH